MSVIFYQWLAGLSMCNGWGRVQDHTSQSCLLTLLRFIHKYIIRAAIRWVMFVLTGKSELERIVSRPLFLFTPLASFLLSILYLKALSREPKYPAEITLGVERLIEDGQLPELCDDWTEDEEPDLADRVLKDNMCYCDKRSAKMGETLRKALAQIRGYRELCALVEARRLEKYDAENAHHEKRLLKLWDILMPDEKLINRVTKQWQKIGFQGDDPATDFRGMGVLSLDQLIFFAQYDVANAREVLSLCTNPEHELPMATAGITFTSMARNLLHKGIFKIHFYNTVAGAPSMDSFHRIYSFNISGHIFKLFYKFWVHREPTSIMEFSFIKNDFEEKLIESLTVESANLHKVDVNELFS
ncbi:unnamed protein product [Toxocara canis]|uniref:ELMO domain-containing protein n=1 Tax=Toxocara canis TaxID=6265 RepID=A0A183UF32_TOXCA|nr:unnamed protein product [Toxocara canis]